jgi:hypothetical protein
LTPRALLAEDRRMATPREVGRGIARRARRSTVACAAALFLGLAPRAAIAAERDGARLQAMLGATTNVISGVPSVDYSGTEVTYFADPLVDDRSSPLGLLEHLQHPDEVSLGLTGGTSRPGTNLGAALSSVIYPWRRSRGLRRGTGFAGYLSFVEALKTYQLSSSFSLEVRQYVSPQTMVRLAYAATRRNDLGATSAFGADTLQYEVASSVLGNRLLVAVQASYAWQFHVFSLQPGAGLAAAERTSGPAYGANSSATWFVTRGFSISARGGLAAVRQQFTTGAQQAWDPSVGAGLEWFPTPCVLARARYGYSTGRAVPTLGAGEPATFHSHAITAVIGARW